MKGTFLFYGKSPPMACLFITMDKNGNSSRCRNWAKMDGEERDLFCSKHPYSLEDPLYAWLKNYALRYSYDLHRKEPWRTIWITEGVSCGLLEITKEDFEGITPNTARPLDWVLFTIICSLKGSFIPEWNLPLWTHVVQQMWRISQSIGPITVNFDQIQDMICVKGDYFTLGINAFPRGLEISQQEWIIFFEQCAERYPEWFEEYWMTRKGTFIAPMEEYYTSWIEVKKQEFLARQMSCRDELIEVSWHPSRALDWIMDTETRKHILQHMRA